MAKLSTGCTSTNVLVLLSLAVCVVLATSAPTASSSCQSPDRHEIHEPHLTTIVSYTSPAHSDLLTFSAHTICTVNIGLG